MGDFRFAQKGWAGKVDAPLNEKLEKVEWGEFELEELFESSNGDFDIQKKHINNKGEYVITAGLSNNGILGKTDIKARIFKENTITIDMFGNAFYRPFKYKIVTHARVFSLKTNSDITQKQGLFLTNCFHFLNKQFGYENMCSWEKIKDKKIQLPIKENNEIDFDFMENFIDELEKAKINQLKNYLKENNLENYNLTDKEKNVLEKFKNGEVEWREYKLEELFEKIKTKKLSFKAKELPIQPEREYILPCLTSSFNNQGLNYFVPKDGATVLKDVISIPSNSDVYRAYFQSKEFTVLSDAYTIKWIYNNKKLSNNQYLFTVSCINQVTDLAIYSYKNKLGGWNVVKNKYIQLPIKNNQIDYDLMETLIFAIKKLVIKNIVLYLNNKDK